MLAQAGIQGWGLEMSSRKISGYYLDLSLYLYHHFDLYGDAEWKLLHAHG